MGGTWRTAVKTQIEEHSYDAAVSKVQTDNLKSWVMEIVGYADSKGNATRNRSLSERRADAVIIYLVTTYNLPLRRLVQPFWYGSLNPVPTTPPTKAEL